MKKHILFLLLVVSIITVLNANEPVKIEIDKFCSNSKNELKQFKIKISSDILNLTGDAVQDNLGGYVDIPEDSYYIKTKNNLYYLKGVVENNKFTSYIYNNSKKSITTKEFYNLKNSKDLKFIQKINLEKNNQIIDSSSVTTTNTLDIYFDEKVFDKKYPQCEKEIEKSKINTYFQYLFLIVFIFIILYLLKKNFKR